MGIDVNVNDGRGGLDTATMTVLVNDTNDVEILRFAGGNEVVSGQVKILTKGGELVHVIGKNFGSMHEPAENYEVTATYGDYEAENCVITKPSEEITCTTVPGIGGKLSWRVVIVDNKGRYWT